MWGRMSDQKKKMTLDKENFNETAYSRTFFH